MRRPVLAATATTALLALAGGPALAADDDYIGLSSDGVHWSDDLARPLFDPDVRWVPGDVRTARFFVRNQQPDDGDLTVDLLQAQTDDLLETGYLQIAARAGDQDWRVVSQTGLHRLLTLDDFPPDSPLAVDIRVLMDPEAPNGTMVLSTDLDLRVTLTDAEVVSDNGGSVPPTPSPGGVIDLPDGSTDSPGGPGGPDGGPDGEVQSVSGFDLPATGSAIPPWLPPLALVLLGSGTYLVVLRRQDEELVEPILRNGAISLENRLNERP